MTSPYLSHIGGRPVKGSAVPAAGDRLAWSPQGYWQPMAGLIDVTDPQYGADPTGVSDSGAAINSAMTAASTGGYRGIFIPAGTYIIEVSLVVPSGVAVYGAGWDDGSGSFGAILKMKNSVNLLAVFFVNATRERIRIENLTIDGNKANNASPGHGIYMHTKWSHFTHIRFQNIKDKAIWLAPTTISTTSSLLNFVEFCEVADSDYGIYYEYPLGDSWIIFNNVGSTTANLRGAGGPNRILSNHMNGSPQYNIYFETAGANTLIDHNLLEGAAINAIYILELVLTPTHSADFNISNNIIKNASRGNDNLNAMIYLSGASAAKQLLNTMVSGNTFIADGVGYKAKWAVQANHVNGLTIQGNTSQPLGTGYWAPPTGTNSNVKIQGNLPQDYNTPAVTVTPYTVLLTDDVVLVNATVGAFVVNLPTAASMIDRVLRIKKTDATGAAVTITPNGAETIDGAATKVLAAQYNNANLRSDGATWWVF